MRLTRCFVPAALACDTTLTLPAGASLHIAKVLRLRIGAALTVFDGRGGEYEARILALERDRVRIAVGAHHALEREARVNLRLLQCLARGERMDWIVQKATELGVSAIVPVSSMHSMVRLEAAAAERRAQHWQAVAASACEQCGRNRLPQLLAVAELESACAAEAALEQQPDGHLRLLLEPDAADSLSSALSALRPTATAPALSLLIGPEGGFSADEIALARHHRFRPVSLGPRVLRTETAPLAALATIQALLGDFSDRAAATK